MLAHDRSRRGRVVRAGPEQSEVRLDGEKVDRVFPSKALVAIRPRANPPKPSSWYCDQCCVEVYERRCPHCGKTEREKT